MRLREVAFVLPTIVKCLKFAMVMVGSDGGHVRMSLLNVTTPASRWHGSVVRVQWRSVSPFRIKNLESCMHNSLGIGAKCSIAEYGNKSLRNTTLT